MSALLLAELEEEAGLPPGWLNVLVGPASEIGDVLVEDERVKLITFTGSSGVGWKLKERAPKKREPRARQCHAADRRGDADLSEAATKVSQNAFAFAGRAVSRCSASTWSAVRTTSSCSSSSRWSKR
jgi:acyl-CoA reductase-like NAD-dependent aldehyde dehydrogenase